MHDDRTGPLGKKTRTWGARLFVAFVGSHGCSSNAVEVPAGAETDAAVASFECAPAEANGCAHRRKDSGEGSQPGGDEAGQANAGAQGAAGERRGAAGTVGAPVVGPDGGQQGGADDGPLHTGDAGSPDDPEGQVAPAATSGPGTVVVQPEDDASYIYDPDRIYTFDVEIDPTDLQRVDEDPKAEQYVAARLRFEDATYEVGYRYKGSVGAFRPPCTTGFDGGPRGGKCSVKLSFNWPDPDGRFFGLKKLQFHAMNTDPSMMRERLGYALFRQMGVPTARATHAILRVNGQPDIYALVEQIDGRFTRSRFTEGGKGNLYKEIWPVHEDPELYLGALKTNEHEMPSVDRMLRFSEAVLDGPEAMAEWLDVEATVRYMAVDRVIMNDDGAFHFYCLGGGLGNNPAPPGNHNYYWYEAEHADRLWLIPWDLDNAMSDIPFPPHIDVDWRLMPEPSQCTCGGGGFGGGLSTPSGCDPLIQNFQAWVPRYEDMVDDFISGPFRKQAVDAQLDGWRQQLTDAGYPVDDSAFRELKTTLDRARTNRGFPY